MFFILVTGFALSLLSSQFVFPQINYGVWNEIADLDVPVYGHSIVTLPDGNIYIFGGLPERGTRIYNVNYNSWVDGPQLNIERGMSHVALLPDSTIIAIGGFGIRSCEIYSPSSNTWTITDSLIKKKKWGQTSSLLPNGDIIITGGQEGIEAVSFCEKFLFSQKKWVVIDSLNMKRMSHSAAVLKDGRLLVSGGSGLNSCEIYDPVLNKWTLVAPMNYIRMWHSTYLTEDGRVVTIGGSSGVTATEIYNPAYNTWEVAGNIFEGKSLSSIFPIDSVNLLIVGGVSHNWTYEIYNLDSLKSIFVGEMPAYRYDTFLVHSDEMGLTQNKNGVVYAIGGSFFAPPLISPTNKNFVFVPYNATDIFRSEIKSNNQPSDLLMIYPNPMNSFANIELKLSSNSIVSLVIYNTLGEVVKVIIDNAPISKGDYKYSFEMGEFPSGVYFLSIAKDFKKQIKKFLLIK